MLHSLRSVLFAWAGAMALLRLAAASEPLAGGTVVFQDSDDAVLPSSGMGSLVFSPNGRHLAVAEPLGVALLDTDTLTLRARIPSKDPVIAFSPSGTRLAALSQDLVVWDLQTGERRTLLRGDPDGTGGPMLSFCGDDRLVVATDKRIQIVDVQAGKALQEVADVIPLYERRMAQTAAPGRGRIAVSLGQGGIAVYDARTGALQRRVAGPKAHTRILDLQFSPDGKLLAEASALGVRVLDAGSGKVKNKRLAKSKPSDEDDDEDSPDQVQALAWYPSGQALALARTGLGRLVSWDIKSGIETQLASGWLRQPGHGNYSLKEVTALGFSTDGRRLAIRGSGLCVFDVTARVPLHCAHIGNEGLFPAASPALTNFIGSKSGRSGVVSVAISDRGPEAPRPFPLRQDVTRSPVRFSGSALDRSAVIAWHNSPLDLQTGQQGTQPAQGQVTGPFHVGRKLYAKLSDSDTQVTLHDLFTGERRCSTQKLPDKLRISIGEEGRFSSEQGERLAVMLRTGDGLLAHVYSTKDCSLYGQIKLPASPLPRVHLTPDGSALVLDEVHNHANRDYDKRLLFFDTKTGEQRLAVEVDNGGAADVKLLFDTQRKRVLADGYAGTTVIHTAPWSVGGRLPMKFLSQLAPDGKTAVAVSAQGICVVDLSTDRCAAALQKASQAPSYLSSPYHFSPDSTRIATLRSTGSDAFEVVVWDRATGAIVATPARTREQVELRFVTPKALALSYSGLRYVRIHDGAQLHLRGSADGTQAAWVADDGTYEGDPGALAETRFRAAGPLLQAKLTPLADLPGLRRPGLLRDFLR